MIPAPQPLRWPPIFPVDRNLVLWFAFDERSGARLWDRSGKRNNGTITGASWVAAKRGAALRFDGLDDYVKVTHATAINPATQITLLAWCKINVDAPASRNPLTKYATVAPWNGYGLSELGAPTAGRPGIWVGAAAFVYAPVDIRDGAWHNWAGSTDGVTTRFYLDGTLRSAVAQTPNLQSTVDLYLSYSLPDATYTPGEIANVQIYNRALNAAEIKRLYEATIG